MELFSYFRSSASYRVRIALGLKGLAYDYQAIHLVKNEQLSAAYGELAPAHMVPLLRDGEATLTQSMAIIEYLDEMHPEPALLPADALGRAQVRALAQDIACEIHPLNNLRVLRYLVRQVGVDDAAKERWIRHWIEEGLTIVEGKLQRSAGRYCFGDTPGLVDCMLVPQVYNAQRFGCAFDSLPTILRVNENCLQLDAFAKAQPSACPDAE